MEGNQQKVRSTLRKSRLADLFQAADQERVLSAQA
jgi:hypothetical protein